MTVGPPESELERDAEAQQRDIELDEAGLASVILVDRNEDVATVCGRVDTAPTFAVVVHAPRGNRSLSTELGMRRLLRHADEAGKVLAVATGSSSLGNRARQVGIPVARRPENVRWESGGRRVLGFGDRTVVLPALGRYIQVAVLLGFLLLFVGAVLTLAPSGEVVAVPPVETLARSVTITASPDVSAIDVNNLVVPAARVSTSQVFTLAAATTGKVAVGTAPARAVVKMENHSNQDATVPAGAVLVAGPQAQRFQVDIETRVPAGQAVTQQATAVRPGVEGNVAAGVAWLWADDRFPSISVGNEAAAAGGASEDRPGVAAEDIVTMNRLATQLQNSEAVKQMLITARPHDAVFLGTAETQLESTRLSATRGEQADFLFMEVHLNVSALAVLSSTLDEVARTILREGEGVGEFVPGSVVATESGVPQVTREDGTVRTQLELRGDFARNVTRDAIKGAVKGKSTSDAESTLRTRYGIEEAHVRTSPGWAPWLPRFDFRIDVQLRSPSSGDTAAAGVPANGEPAPTATSTPRP